MFLSKAAEMSNHQIGKLNLVLVFITIFHSTLSLDLKLPDVSLPVEPNEQTSSGHQLSAAKHHLSGAGRANLEKKQGAAEKNSNYEKDRGFYYVKAYGWDREKKNEHASGHGQMLRADKAAKFDKQKARLDKHGRHESSALYGRPHVQTDYKTMYTPQVDYLESKENSDAYLSAGPIVSTAALPPLPKASSVQQYLNNNNNIYGSANIAADQHRPAVPQYAMFGPHVPGHDYRYRIQPTRGGRDDARFNKGFHGDSEHYKRSNNLNPHLHELIQITKNPKTHFSNYKPNYSPVSAHTPHLGSVGGDGERGVVVQDEQQYPPSNLVTNRYPPAGDEPSVEYNGHSEDEYGEGNDDDDDEGKYYYDRPMSAHDLKQLRQGHGKFEGHDNSLYEQYYPNRRRFEHLPKFQPSLHRYRLYRGSHYYA